MNARTVVFLLLVLLAALVLELALSLSRAPEGGLPVFRPGLVVGAVLISAAALAALRWLGGRRQ